MTSPGAAFVHPADRSGAARLQRRLPAGETSGRAARARVTAADHGRSGPTEVEAGRAPLRHCIPPTGVCKVTEIERQSCLHVNTIAVNQSLGFFCYRINRAVQRCFSVNVSMKRAKPETGSEIYTDHTVM